MLFYKLQALVSSFNEAYSVCFEVKKDRGFTIYSKDLEATFNAILDMADDYPVLKETIETNSTFQDFFYNHNSLLGFTPSVIQVRDGKAFTTLKEDSYEFLRQLYILLSEVNDIITKEIENCSHEIDTYHSYLFDVDMVINDSDADFRRRTLIGLYQDKMKHSNRKEKHELRKLCRRIKKYRVPVIHEQALAERDNIIHNQIPTLHQTIKFYLGLHNCINDCNNAITAVVASSMFFDRFLEEISKENLLEME